MLIGDSVNYRGRRYVVVGLTPFSVIPFSLQLQDPETNRTFWVEWPPDTVERAALRLVDEDSSSTD